VKKFLVLFLPGLIVGVVLMWGGGKAVEATSTDKFCNSCHIHPQADASWKKSVHYETASGFRTHCTDCHLPPKGEGYLPEKARTGLRDLWSYWFKDSASFDWDAKSKLDHAVTHVYEASCLKCHPNLFPAKLTKEGMDAHLYYDQQVKKGSDIRCINCHLNAGHYDPNYTHAKNTGFGVVASSGEVYTEPTKVEKFETFEEKIPNSGVSFKMVAIPGGSFKIGSPDQEQYRNPDEGPVKEVQLDQFWMGEIEVSWDEYMTFFAQTSRGGKTATDQKNSAAASKEVDAIVGATPPYGQPDQNWGKGKRPAISMSHHAAEVYCQWLSKVTGKTYRLPTEAEWEYAARAGKETPYFFEGDPKQFMKKKLFSSKRDTTMINRFVVYQENSRAKTQEPSFVIPNPYGLKNMLGNVAEFCADWYSPNAYESLSAGSRNPKGPASGTEHVVRGGSFKSTADQVRSAARAQTQTEQWLRTDPQSPKSIWWYSDCFFVGFRVVCEYDDKTGKI
jgi:formylglycine-generating enzyme required for sulfatase activity